MTDELAPKPKRKYTRKPKAAPLVDSPEKQAVYTETLSAAAPPMPKPRKSRVSILERRKLSPFGEESSKIDFKDPSLSGRWFNMAVRPNQFHRAVSLGWEKVRPEMLADLDQLGHWHRSEEGFVTRGERGQELLMYMPLTDREAIQASKTRENNKRMGNPNAQLREAAEALGSVSPEGADFLHRHAAAGTGGPTGGVKDFRERMERTPDA